MDNASTIEKQLLSLIYTFLSEMDAQRALSRITINASIEKDLGIDSLGRVELLHRIEDSFSIHLSEKTLGEAETIQDLVQAILSANPPKKTSNHQFNSVLTKINIDVTNEKSLVSVLKKYAQTDPDRPHIYLQDEHGNEKVITYGLLFSMSESIAKGLIKNGLQKSDTVAIMLPTCEQFFFAFFGILLAGGIPVPMYPPFRLDRIEEYATRGADILRNAEAKILITYSKTKTLGKLLRTFVPSLKQVITTESLIIEAGTLKNIVINNNDIALIQYTSGSTGYSKGVVLTHENLLANIKAFGQGMNVTSKDVAVSWLPLYHDMGLIGAWLGNLYHGIPIVIMSPLTFLMRPERWLWAIHYHRATLSGGPNFAYELCVRKIDDKSIKGLDLSSWRIAANGAEAVNPNTIRRFSKKFSHYGFNSQAYFPVYGLAETAVALTFPPLNREPRIETIDREIFEKKLSIKPADKDKKNYLEFVSCGKALPKHKIQIVDDSQKPLQENEIGHIQFQGPSSMQGYLANEKDTQAIYHDGWWDTGDLGYISGDELFVTGRKKDLIIKAGRNISPEAIENATSQVDEVRKGCVVAFGIKDDTLGTEQLIIVAETKVTQTHRKESISKKIITHIATVLGIPPDQVLLVSPGTVPKTSSGKLQRSACKQNYLNNKLTKKRLPALMQITKLYIMKTVSMAHDLCKKILHGIYSCYAILLMLVIVPFIWLIIIFLPKILAEKCCKLCAKIIFLLFLCPVYVHNKKLLTSCSPMIFIANHTSYLDAILLLSVVPTGSLFIGKKELLKNYLINSFYKKIGFITVDRIDFSQNIEDAKHIAKELKNKKSIIIFPEGTFTKQAGIRPFKLGAFKLAVETKTSICPIAIKGSRYILGDGHYFPKPGAVTLTVLPALQANNDSWSEVIRLSREVRKVIAKYSGERQLDLMSATLPDKH